MTDLQARRTAKQTACAESAVGHVFQTTATGQKCVRCAMDITNKGAEQ